TLIYNHPGRTGLSFAPAALRRLLQNPQHSHLLGLKDSSGSTECYFQFRQVLNHFPGRRLYSGDDAMVPFFAPMGMEGLTSVASNIWPHEVRLFAEKCRSGALSSSDYALWKQ